MDNYFGFYSIRPSFTPDPAIVKARYYELSRAFHPDKFANADDADRLASLQQSSLNNKAYKTLTNPDATMAYILKWAGVMQDEEKYALPSAFLMEMMDLNEALSDYEADPANLAAGEAVNQALTEQLAEWGSAAKVLTDKYDAGDQSEQLLLQIKDMYYRKKYLLRIKERITKFAAQ